MPDMGERVARLEETVETLNHRLYGNGNKGDIAELSESIRSGESAIATIRSDIRWYLGLAVGAIAAVMFFTGNGFLTFDHVLKLLGVIKP